MIVSCSGGETETVARITQRRHVPGGRLLVSYQFRVGEQLISDSVELANRVIPKDSVKVVFSPENPHSSRLLLP